VDLVDSGDKALNSFSNSEFDLIISDRSMPGMTGDELAAEVKRISPEKPVILMTGFGDIMIARGEKPEGVDHVLPKPVDQATFRRAIAATALPN
ncbi:MAG: response regulator, partial [Verrucomicrobiales bacterium]|nr:response regulator [Verrucomicrobiales bacterium]